MAEHDIQLDDGFEYSHKGATEMASFVKILPPTTKHLTHCAELKQAFYRATKDIKNVDAEQPTQENAKITGSDILALMYGSDHVEMSKVLLHARELLTSGVCLVDGEEKLTKPLFDLMSQDDAEKILGEYLANFTLLSVLKKIQSS